MTITPAPRYRGRSSNRHDGIWNLWDRLVRPSLHITDAAVRRKARLQSIFLLILFVLFAGVNTAYAVYYRNYGFPPADIAGFIMMLSAYAFSRTRWMTVATHIMIAMMPVNVYATIALGNSPNVTGTLAYLIPSFILASIFLSAGILALYGLGNCLIVCLTPLWVPASVPDLTAILGQLWVLIISTALLVTAVVHRNHIENDHHDTLNDAYDETLAGWARALEIRDRETEGHTRRVAGLSLELARIVGVAQAEMINVFRGAMLHDIGKMAIPDSILLKDGELTAEEWTIMRSHTKIACEMFANIRFLRPALNIPAHHHERWDGTGYPDGLKGEAIPLAARIFAVVDVWDALLSDRPYRKAWIEENVIAYLREQSGRQFDPAIVEKFLEMLVSRRVEK